MNESLLLLAFVVGIICGVGITLGGLNNQVKSNTPLVPSIEVKCIDNVCDTTYIYSKPNK